MKGKKNTKNDGKKKAENLFSSITRLDYHPDYQENEPVLLNKTGLKTASELGLAPAPAPTPPVLLTPV